MPLPQPRYLNAKHPSLQFSVGHNFCAGRFGRPESWVSDPVQHTYKQQRGLDSGPFLFSLLLVPADPACKKTNPKKHHVVFKSLEDPAIRSLGVGEAELE